MDGGFGDPAGVEARTARTQSGSSAQPLSASETFAQLCFLNGLLLLMLAATAFLAPRMAVTLSPWACLGGYLLSQLVQLIALAQIDRARTYPPALCVGAISILSMIAAYVIVVSVVFPGRQSAYGGVMFALAMTPYFGASCIWLLRSDRDESGAFLLRAFGFLSVAHFMALSLLSVLAVIGSRWSVPAVILTGVYASCLVPPVAANWLRATKMRLIPWKMGEEPNHEHISGVGAIAMIVFVSTIVMLGLWAAAAGVGAEISRSAGVIVIVGLAVTFLVVAISPHVPRNARMTMFQSSATRTVKPVGDFFSYLDSLLVFPVAGAIGVNQSNLWVRYALLLGYLTPCAILGWWLPAPYGLVPCAWAVITTMAVARRWAWIEEDRENAMLNRRFEGEHIKVGFEQDLRDETLLGFMALFLIVPIALRQMHLVMGDALFIVDAGANINNIWVWLGFFGTELAKAVPFVDWAEIYQVQGAAAIHISEDHVGSGQHVIFATRVLVDLVFLAALLQAISISQRTAKLKDMFYVDKTLNRLDPFLELKELRKLVVWRDGSWQRTPDLFEAFPRYDPDRLEELRARYDGRAIGYVAEYLLHRDEERPAERLLLEESKRAEPDEGWCSQLLDQIELFDAPNIGELKAAHFILIKKPHMRAVRGAITNIIAGKYELPGAVNALSDILIGPGDGSDPRAEVRLIALYGLYRPALEGNEVARKSIEYASKNDVAKVVREAAQRLLNAHADWSLVR